MLVLGVTWIWSVTNLILWGYMTCRILQKLELYQMRTLFSIPVAGICVLTVYAEIFSLFSGVGLAANVGLAIVDLIVVIIWGRDLLTMLFRRYGIRQWLWRILLILAVFLLLYPASHGIVQHYDTYLYHAQAIRWIEEYGAVKGLGNLHARFAYNSSFLCLQALFSLAFLFHRSIHTMNAVCAWILLCYAIGTLKCLWKGKLMPSDFLKFGLIYTLMRVGSLELMSSPGTDMLVQGLVGYIFAEWASRVEDSEKEVGTYASLCVLGVFAASLKLSAVLIILLMIKPLIRLIKDRQKAKILIWLGMGILVLIPYLARNVIISGYLVYPYPELDLFSVDWKMNSYMARIDRAEIQSWARGLNDWHRFSAPFGEWIPVWWSRNAGNIITKALVLSLVLVIPVGIVQTVRLLRTEKDQKEYGRDYLLLISVMLINLLFFLYSAPNIRFGCIYLTLIPMLVIGTWLSSRSDRCLSAAVRGIPICAIGIFCLIAVSTANKKFDFSYGLGYWHYDRYHPGVANELDGQVIYVPEKGDQISYEYFPSTPYKRLLEIVETRGNSPADGYRLREEYKNRFITNTGKILEEDPFE